MESVGCTSLEKATYGKEGKTVKTARLIKDADRLTEIIQIGSEAGVIVRSELITSIRTPLLAKALRMQGNSRREPGHG
jgi:hypothetical protein